MTVKKRLEQYDLTPFWLFIILFLGLIIISFSASMLLLYGGSTKKKEEKSESSAIPRSSSLCWQRVVLQDGSLPFRREWAGRAGLHTPGAYIRGESR